MSNIGASIHHDRSWWNVLQPTLDTISIIASLVAVKWVSRGYMDERAIVVGVIAAIAFVLFSRATGASAGSSLGNVNREMQSVLITWALTVMVVALLGFATRFGSEFSRLIITGWIITAPALIGYSRMACRIVQRSLLARGIGTRNVAIAGLNQLGIQASRNIASDPGLGLKLSGFYDDRVVKRDISENEVIPNLTGNLDRLVKDAKAGEIDMILVTLPMRAEARIGSLLQRLSDSTVSVYIVPDFFVFELLHSRWTALGGLPAVSVFENPLYGVDGVLKRASDLVIGIAALLMASVPMIAVALAVKLTSPGPIFFRQKRYGLDGQEIMVWKFRSMTTCDNGPVVKQATKGDKRITPVGAFIRKTSLDELPQLFNVLEGTMSLVGPRPHASAHNEQYRGLIPGYMLRHKVKPGITGLAQVNGCRGETDTIEKMQKRVEFDHQYIRAWSLWLDLKILFRTLLVAWRQPEAY